MRLRLITASIVTGAALAIAGAGIAANHIRITPGSSIAAVAYQRPAQPNGSQYFQSTTTGGFSYNDAGYLVLEESPSSPTRFVVVNGNSLQQSGTSKCLTLNTNSNQDQLTSPCNSRPTQQFDYRTFGTGAEAIISAYNGLCATDVGGGFGQVIYETCDINNVLQRWKWHS